MKGITSWYSKEIGLYPSNCTRIIVSCRSHLANHLYRNIDVWKHDGFVERGGLRPEREHFRAWRERKVVDGEVRLGVGERVVDDVLIVHRELLRILEVLLAVNHSVGEVKERALRKKGVQWI